MRDEVHDAILNAADAGNDRLNNGSWGSPGSSSSSRHRVAAIKRTVMRFLENLPDDATVHDLREAMDDGGIDDE